MSIAPPPGQQGTKNFLDRIADDPPQVILIEGGTMSDRKSLAFYFAARLNCENADKPCGICPTCRQINDNVYTDLVFFDGEKGNIRIERPRDEKVSDEDYQPAIREDVIAVVGHAPRCAKYRVFIFHEAGSFTPASANALLKTLEEPRPGNVFILLAAQREKLLPTLVSRSWCITCAWPDVNTFNPELNEWLEDLVYFMQTGKGWFERTQARKSVDRVFAERLITELQRTLAQTMGGNPRTNPGKYWLDNFEPKFLWGLYLIFNQAQEALFYQTSPTLTLDWLALNLHLWTKRNISSNKRPV